MALMARISPELSKKRLKLHGHQERMRLFNDSYAKLRSSKKEWKNERKEQDDLEGTAADGLD